eukprot:TRINITY_DN2594_c0_g4_i1.p1 TRINITY_DN2594_c0_g4~~TRINITY_DN2594_c0_g4_i1.p1  ORF type:complete len:144 (+),score=27.26 TRINITY_DN2594_c0_g4_i1:39-470(+)
MSSDSVKNTQENTVETQNIVNNNFQRDLEKLPFLDRLIAESTTPGMSPWMEKVIKVVLILCCCIYPIVPVLTFYFAKTHIKIQSIIMEFLLIGLTVIFFKFCKDFRNTTYLKDIHKEKKIPAPKSSKKKTDTNEDTKLKDKKD